MVLLAFSDKVSLYQGLTTCHMGPTWEITSSTLTPGWGVSHRAQPQIPMGGHQNEHTHARCGGAFL